MLDLERVSKGYTRGTRSREVLIEVSLAVHAGEIVVVNALPGQGKTTLLKLAAGVEAPDGGVVRFEGRDLATLSDRELSALLGGGIGWVASAGPDSHMRTLDYVALPLLIGSGHRRAGVRAAEALERLGVAECADQQWETLGDRERALVGIAHAIVRSPKLLLVDDATTILGIRHTDEVIRVLRTFSAENGCAVLMTGSDASSILGCDRIVSLGGGRLTGPPAADPANVIAFPRPAKRVS